MFFENNYYKPNITKEWIQKNSFRYSNIYSDNEENAYSYRFPVYKDKGNVLLECELVVFEESGRIGINVFSCCTRDEYIPFYNRRYGENNIIPVIDEKIKKEFLKLGIINKKCKTQKQKGRIYGRD